MDLHIASANDFASQWLSSLWTAVWQSALLAFAVLILARFLKNASASLRFWIWMLVPLRLLVMPFVCITVPVLPAPSVHDAAALRATSASPTLSDETASPWSPDGQQVYVAAALDGTRPASSASEIRTSIKWPLVALTIWGIGVLVLSLRMARGWFWMRRLVADSTRVFEGPLMDAANKAAALLGLKTVPRLVVTGAQVSPFTCGVRRPLVVLPKTFVQKANRHSLLAVLAHEFAHVRRRDSLLGFVLCICDAIYFFHPVVHLVRRRILFEREKACDALVLAASKACPSAYASAICDAAQFSMSTRSLTSPPLLVAESFGDLKGRLTALASEAAPRARLSLASVFVLLLLGILCVPGIILTTSDPVESAVLAPAVESPSQTNPQSAVQPLVRLTAADSVTVAPPQQPEATRVIRFPKDRAIGMLYTQTTPTVLRYRLSPNYSAVDSWDVLAAAQGNVTVPVDAKVKLIIAGQAIQGDLSPLVRLKPDDLYALEISCYEDVRPYSDNTIMPHLSELTGLKELTVRLPDLTDQGMRHLKALTGLEFLSVSGLGVTDAGLKYLEDMQSLQVLSCWTTLTDDGLAHVGKLPALQELSINVTSVKGPGLAHIAKLPALEYLWLSGENFGNSGLQYLRDFPALKSLRLHGENLRISNLGMKYIGQIHGLEELQLIRFEGVTDAGLEYLKPLHSLRLLELHKSITTDAALATISELESLEDLSLSNNPKSLLTDVGLSYLPKLKHLKRLQTMGWSKTSITDAGLRTLSTMSSLQDLQVCGGEGITDAGIAHLAKMSGLESLAILSDSHSISDTSLGEISKLSQLKRLDLFCSATPFTVSGLNKLNALGQLEYLRVDAGQRGEEVLDWSGMTHLADLMLGMPQTRDADLVSLGKLTSLKRLQCLTGITDVGLSHLAGLTELQFLNIQHSNVSDDGLRHLENMKKLYHLIISGKFSSQGLEHLEGLSGLQILNITSITPLDEATLAHVQSKLPNLRTLRAGEPEGFGGLGGG